MHVYNEAYLDDVVESQGKLFDFIATNYPDKDTEEFIKAYVNTMFAKELWDYFVETEGYKLKPGKSLKGFIPRWIGEFYAYYQWYYDIPSSGVIKKAPFRLYRESL